MAKLRYDTIRDAILTCAQKPTWVSLIYRTETTTKKWKTEKLKSKKTDMLRSIFSIMSFVKKNFNDTAEQSGKDNS